MNIAELKAAAEMLAEFDGDCIASYGTTEDMRDALASAFDAARDALPKLLAVVEAAQETAETGGNILGLKEALHALEGKEADNVDR